MSSPTSSSDVVVSTVTTQFQDAQNNAITAFASARDAITALQNYITSQFGGLLQRIAQALLIPSEAPVPEPNPGLQPTPPGLPAGTTFADIALAPFPNISPVNFGYVPEFPTDPGSFTGTAPTMTARPPVNDFEFSENMYGSQLLTDLRTKLDWYIQNGGTGLGPAVEAAIWADNQLRVQQEFEKQYEQAESFWAARGFNMPPGMLQAAISEAITEQTRKLTYTSNEIAIEQARIAKDQTKTMYELSGTLETATMNYFSQVAGRALDASKFSVDAAIQIFKAAVDYFTAQMQAYRISAEVFGTEVEAFKAEVQAETSKVEAYKAAAETALASNKQFLDIFAAEIEQYKAQIQYEMARVDSLVKIFSSQTGLFDAEVRLSLGDFNANIEIFKGQIQETQINAQIAIETAKLEVQTYLGQIEAVIKALSSTAEVGAHLAAAALASIHAAAQLSEQASTYQDLTVPITT
ncbi:MAG: hypothetical protein ACLQBD_01150 [Syntrophobacteraceae bacterium]